MKHKMKLNNGPFERIKNGTKTVEFRLYDEKRKQIKIGDKIEFSKLPDMTEKLLVEVLDLYREESFEKLKSMMNDNKETITVHVVDTIFTDVKTFKKSEITRYGSY